MFPPFIDSFGAQFNAVMINSFGTIFTGFFGGIIAAFISAFVTPFFKGIAGTA